MIALKSLCLAGILLAVEPAGYCQSKNKISEITFDTAPGTVSAINLLGVGADDTTIVKNPRDFTVLLKTFRGEEALGISLTPARTAIAPLDLKEYSLSYESSFGYLTRLWANFAVSYAQGQSDISEIKVDRRAVALESSFYLNAEDDPVIAYYRRLSGKKTPCVIVPETPPDGSGVKLEESPDIAKVTSANAKACRDAAQKDVRWNASRAWLSVSTGDYKNQISDTRKSIGKSIVVGGTYGIDNKLSTIAGTVTLAATKALSVPTAKSMAVLVPDRQDSTLIFLQMAAGSQGFQVVAQGTNVRSGNSLVVSRSYKRALGIDWRIQEGMWLLLRSGSQRKLDNTGNENTSTFTLNISPSMDLKLF